MSANPYMLGGFEEGFSKGLDIVWKMEDRKVAKEDREDRLSKEREDREAQVEERGLRKKEHELRVQEAERAAASAETPEEAIQRRREEGEERRLGLKERKYKQGRQEKTDYFDDTEKLHTSAEQVLEGITETIASDPEWGNKMQALYGAIKADEWHRPEVYSTGLDLLRKTYSKVIQQGINSPVSDRTAKEQGVPPGSVIVDKQLKSFAVDEKTGDVVLVLEVITEKDGVRKAYDAPYTKNRTDAPDDEVLVLTKDSFEKMFRGGAEIERGLQQGEKAGISRQESLHMARGAIAQRRQKKITERKTAREADIESYAEEHGITKAEAQDIFRRDEMLKKLNGLVQSYINAGMTPDAAADKARADLGITAQGSGAASTPVAATGQEGWSVEVVTPEQVVGE